MRLNFNIPQRPEELEQEGSDALRVFNTLDTASLSVEEVACRAQELLFQLESNDPLHPVADQECFDNLYYTVKAFGIVGSRDKARLVDILSTNLGVLSSSVNNLHQDRMSSSDPTAIQHRSAVQLHAFHLNWALLQAETAGAKDDQEQRQADAGKKGVRGRKTGAANKKGAGHDEWDLGRSRDRALKAASKLLCAELNVLYPAEHEKQRLVDTCIQMAARAIESPEAMRRPESKSSTIEVLILAAKNHDKLASVAETLVAACRRMEHVSELAAYVAIQAKEANNFPRLTEQLISEFTLTSPAMYDKEPEKHRGVKHLGDMLVCMAESKSLAKTVAGQLALLVPYLACGNESIRCAIVHMLGALVAEVFPEPDGASTERNQSTRLTTKRQCLLELLMRLMDTSARVRTKSLKAWTMLVAEDKVPLPEWPRLLKAVQARLLDGKPTVVKAALQLFQVMIEMCPFGEVLDLDKLQATLKVLEENLEALGPLPDDDAEGEDGIGLGGAAWDEGGALQVGAERAQKEAAEKAERVEGASQGDDRLVEGANAKGRVAPDGDAEMDDLMHPTQTQSRDVSLISTNPIKLRFMIAQIKSGIEFVRIVESSEVEIRKLLTVHDAGNIKDAIHLLTLWKQKGLPNADNALRGTWALIFLRDEAVRAAVVDAFYNQYLVSRPDQRLEGPAHQAWNVIAIAHNNTQGESAALEEILRLLCAPGITGADARLSPHVVGHIIRFMSESYNDLIQLQRQMVAEAKGQAAGRPAASAGSSPDPASAGAENVVGADGEGGGSHDNQCDLFAQKLSVVRSAMSLVATVAVHNPDLAVSSGLRVTPLLQMLQGATVTLKDAWVVRHCCIAIKALAPQVCEASAAGEHAPFFKPVNRRGSSMGASEAQPQALHTMLHGACQLLVQVLATQGLGQQNWQSAAGAALAALYALHPMPSTLTTPLLKAFLVRALAGTYSANTGGSKSALGTSSYIGAAAETSQQQSALPEAEVVRLLFLTGHVAMHQLVLIERLAKDIRRKRMEHERAAASKEQALEDQGATGSGITSTTADAGSSKRREGAEDAEMSEKAVAAAAAAKEDEDIAKQLGCGSMVADAALDALQEQIDAEIMGRGSLLGLLGHGFVVPCCYDMELLLANPSICESALLALTKLMAVDGKFCEDHMQLLFTRLSNKALGPAVRSNLVIALGDLAVRFPNITEPWTVHMYAPLGDADLGVRRTSLTVLGHLILNDMMKVKGNIARIALRLVDEEEELRIWARRFFATLAQRSSDSRGGSNPIYNLLPDIMSALVREPALDPTGFSAIMEVLLPYVKDSKQADAFKEKLCQRFEALQEETVARAADFAAARGAAQAGIAAGVEIKQEAGLGAEGAHGADACLGALTCQQAGLGDGGETSQEEGAAIVALNAEGAPAHADQHLSAAMGGVCVTLNVTLNGVAIQGASGVAYGGKASGGMHSSGSQAHSPSCSNRGAPAASGDSFFSACSAGGEEASSYRSASVSHQGGAEAVSSGMAGTGRGPQSHSQGDKEGNWVTSLGVSEGSTHKGQDGDEVQPASQNQSKSKFSVVEERRALATVLKGMGHTEKGLRAIMERRRCYKHALGDEQVYKVFWSIAEEGRKKASKDSTLREEAASFRSELEEIHKALCLGNVEDQDEQGEADGEEEGGVAKGDKPEDVEMEDVGDQQYAPPGVFCRDRVHEDSEGPNPVAAVSEGSAGAIGSRRRGRAQREQEQQEDVERRGGQDDALSAETPSGKPPGPKRLALNGMTPAAMKIKPEDLGATKADAKGRAAAAKRGKQAVPRKKKQVVSSDEEEGDSSSEQGEEESDGDDDGHDAGSRDQQASGLAVQAKRLGRVQLGGGAQRVVVKQEPDC